nr:sensory neuron membrane protein [Odontothrips loti]
MRRMWQKAPISLDFRIYMFNVTNPEAAARGEIPIVTEIGPYFYHEWKEKVDLEDHPADDTVSFHLQNTFIFNETISAPFTGDELVTIPHAAMLTMVYSAERHQPAALSILSKAINPLFNNPTTPFLTEKVRNILFDGVPINCTSSDFAAAAVCTIIRSNPKRLKPQGDGIFLFSFFGMRNGSADPVKLEVKRGATDVQEVGKVVRVDGKEKINVWDGEPCNTPRGTDSTIFPPFLGPQDSLISYSTDLCMSLGAKFEKEVVLNGISGYLYTSTLGDMTSDPEMKCLCPTPDTCLKKGLIDLTKCTGAPFVASMPHLFATHEDYQMMVQGLHPDEDKHGLRVVIEPRTATPLSARRRLQFNMFTHPVPKVPAMKNMAEALVPILWIEEGIDLPDVFLELLETNLFRTLRIMDAATWTALGLGLLLALGGAALFVLRRKTTTLTLTKVR